MSSARVVSVNVALPRDVDWKGKTVTTGIFKEPVSGPVMVRRLNLDVDRQADLSVHGGPDKAVYAYPAEHYAPWQAELGRELPWGMFGENLTLEGLPLEDELAIGDRLGIGAAEFVVCQPRMPCFKLGIRFDDAMMVKRFLQARRSVYYLRVAVEGEIAAGETVTLLERDREGVPVSEVTRLFLEGHDDVDALRRVLRVDALPEGWRSYFEEQFEDARPALPPQ
jgi:MOSC domain-containing protein YiiM